ncbi:hypothetical protein GCM10025864_08560 [Luteimicrobium album]|uniref:Uncharacterized protein n=1 Tax=Luteimicrobium album TaxID=1054550 RepID=A0ABQ6HXH2_9MICO|nr:hypothetical protein [Luteimicrobium album]GMA23097.1 hypothetical protein GCM10025864_08560 [Luteimicrobium album]
MSRRSGRGDGTVEVVVEPDDGGTHADPPPRRVKHPWRWTTALVVVVALPLGAVQWQRLGREVDVVDAGLGWTSGFTLSCSGGSQSIVHWAADHDSTGDPADAASLGDEPQDIVTLTNMGARTATLRLADPAFGAFERHVVVGTAPGAPSPDRVATADHVVVPAGASARLRLVTTGPTVTGARGGSGLVWVSSVVLRVTTLGVTTTREVPLTTRIAVLGSVDSGRSSNETDTGTPWPFADDLCGPPTD